MTFCFLYLILVQESWLYMKIVRYFQAELVYLRRTEFPQAFFPKSSRFSRQHFPVIYKLAAETDQILDSILTLQMNASYHAQKLWLLKAMKVAGIIFQVFTVFQLCKVFKIRHKV